MAVANIIPISGFVLYDPGDDDEVVIPTEMFVFQEAAAGFVPYPNPRYAMSGGHQIMGGGVG